MGLIIKNDTKPSTKFSELKVGDIFKFETDMYYIKIDRVYRYENSNDFSSTPKPINAVCINNGTLYSIGDYDDVVAVNLEAKEIGFK